VAEQCGYTEEKWGKMLGQGEKLLETKRAAIKGDREEQEG